MTVLLVGFGGPETLAEVPAFVQSVLNREPPEYVVSGAVRRYQTIGGGSPLPAVTRRQAKLVGEELARRGVESDVHVGMLHARPTITEIAARIVADDVRDLVVLSLAPYRCEVSTDAYFEAVSDAFDGSGVNLHFGDDWNRAPGYVDALAGMLAEARDRAPAGTSVIFAAHSLPTRMIEQGDPYADQLQDTARAVAAAIGLEDWHLAYQSVSAAAREPWLRPSVEEVLDSLAARGARSVLIDPIGFIADHVETLYDNDIEHRGHAATLDLEFHRCLCLNEHSGLIATLAGLALGVMSRV